MCQKTYSVDTEYLQERIDFLELSIEEIRGQLLTVGLDIICTDEYYDEERYVVVVAKVGR